MTFLDTIDAKIAAIDADINREQDNVVIRLAELREQKATLVQARGILAGNPGFEPLVRKLQQMGVMS